MATIRRSPWRLARFLGFGGVFTAGSPRLLDMVQSNLLFDGTRLTATYAKPFCWLAEGQGGTYWLPLLDSFRNWMNTEECRELAAAV